MWRVDGEHLLLGKSTSNMWEYFKDQLVRIQDQHVPVKMKDRDGKVGQH